MARVESPPLDSEARFHEWVENDMVPALLRRVKIAHTFGTAVDTPERIRHGLGAVPEGYIVVDSDRACIVYRASDAPKADSRYIWLECNTASAAVTLLIF